MLSGADERQGLYSREGNPSLCASDSYFTCLKFYLDFFFGGGEAHFAQIFSRYEVLVHFLLVVSLLLLLFREESIAMINPK